MAAEYSKGRDFISSTKMNYFHYFLKQLTGYTLHPLIKIDAQPCRIADMGVQTAVWALDIAEDRSFSAKVDGFDVSDKFFPPSPWLPANLKLHTHDICNPFPNDLIGQYDVVHFRLFITISRDKLHQMVQNAFKLLKPGGYIQWVEHDKTNLKPVTSRPGQSTETVQALIELEQNPFPGYNAKWVNDIAPAMMHNRLKVLAEDRIQTRPSMLLQMNELHLLAMMDVPKGLSKAVDEFKAKHLEAMEEDNQRGVSSIDGFIVVVGQKPVS